MKDEDITICLEVMTEVSEIFYEMRKGIAQTYYVGEVSSDAEYWDDHKDDMVKVPDHLVGFYRMDNADDLRYINFKDGMRDYGFSKCKKIEIITYEYRVIEKELLK